MGNFGGNKCQSASCAIIGNLIILWFCYTAVHAKHCVPEHYNTTAQRVDNKLNVHIVPHTHDDPGWLKTVDQYYYGANETIQSAAVQYILDTVVSSLAANKNRKFIYGEMAFFTRWWDEQSRETKEVVKSLVKSGQLVFVNGGWVQHDEAVCHYVAMIDQTTRGHMFLNETFGVVPTVGWQIDPFGHSSTHASLMVATLGFDALFFGRAHYQDMEIRKKTKELEMVWRGSHSFGRNSDVFTSNLASGNYGPPDGFNFEYRNSPDPPIMDSTCLSENNVAERVNKFVEQAYLLSNMTRGDDIMFTMGTDFTYENANVWFKNMDKLIHWVNLDGRINAFYSSPAEYAAAKNSYTEKWPLKLDDFVPYADCPTCYWTGFYTSRAASKGYIRHATSYLQAARQLDFLSRQVLGRSPPGDLDPSTDTLEEAVALTQHHDAITGTEKQHVAADYHMRLDRGLKEAEQLVLGVLEDLVYKANGMQNTVKGADQVQLMACPMSNLSICAPSVAASLQGFAFLAVIYNPLAWPRSQGVRIPVLPMAGSLFVVTGPDGQPTASQLLPISRTTEFLQALAAQSNITSDTSSAATHELAVMAELPPLGYSVYTIQSTNPAQPPSAVATFQFLPATPRHALSDEAKAQATYAMTHQPKVLESLGDPQQSASGEIEVAVQIPVENLGGVLQGNLVLHRSGDSQSDNVTETNASSPEDSALASGDGPGGDPTTTEDGASSSSSSTIPPGHPTMVEGTTQGGSTSIPQEDSAGLARDATADPRGLKTNVGPAYPGRPGTAGTGGPGKLGTEGTADPGRLSTSGSPGPGSLGTDGTADPGRLGTDGTADPGRLATHGMVEPGRLGTAGTASHILLGMAGTSSRGVLGMAGTANPGILGTSGTANPGILGTAGTAHLERLGTIHPSIKAAGVPAAATTSPAVLQQTAQGAQMESENTPEHVSGSTVGAAADVQNSVSAISILGSWATGQTVQTSYSHTELGYDGGPQLLFANESGQIISWRLADRLEAIKFGLNMAWYKPRGSGAYIFDPEPEEQPKVLSPTGVTLVLGPVVTEIRQAYDQVGSLVIRLWKGAKHVEVEWTAGPIMDDGEVQGREIVLQYTTTLHSGDMFYTDSNGREIQPRRLNFSSTWPLNVTEPVAGNYYPVTAAIYISGTDGDLTVVPDRSEGGSSLRSGEIELMLHRRTDGDDHRGVEQPLAETMCGGSIYFNDCAPLVVRGTHLVSLQESESAAKERRQLQQMANDPVLVAYGPYVPVGGSITATTASKGHTFFASNGSTGLPHNVHLLTMKPMDDGRLLLRLAHLFQEGEDADMSTPVTVDLNKLLAGITFVEVLEATLSGTRPLSQVKRKVWNGGGPLAASSGSLWGPSAAPREAHVALECSADCHRQQLPVELYPMEIRTFLLRPSTTT